MSVQSVTKISRMHSAQAFATCEFFISLGGDANLDSLPLQFKDNRGRGRSDGFKQGLRAGLPSRIRCNGNLITGGASA